MESKWKKFIPLIILGVIVFLLVCAYIIINRTGMPTKTNSEVAGFWLGLWQGFIIFLTFVTSWFDKNIVLYQSINDGFLYNLGFFIGLTISIGAGAKSSKNKSKSKIPCI